MARPRKNTNTDSDFLNDLFDDLSDVETEKKDIKKEKKIIENELAEKNEDKDEKSMSDKVVITKNNNKFLSEEEEIEVISLISNVSYKDSRTGDMYKWDNIGDIELMEVSVLKNMWRNNKGYFKSFWLKPLDDRIISLFKLQKFYDEYDFLLDNDSYTRENIEKISNIINNSNKEIKISVFNHVKTLIDNSIIYDINVIRELESVFNEKFI